MTENFGGAGSGSVGSFSDAATSTANTLGGVTDSVGSLVGSIIKVGPGGTITQDMVDHANKIKPAVDKANG
ncbi:hypothetical protein ACFVYR_28375 [Streptomyces sp. NPDC058284]|uniref:hypothetical protein n=1 Tax=unclassified Streptomyces TaxID=2593676 RepID=UPI00365C4650